MCQTHPPLGSIHHPFQNHRERKFSLKKKKKNYFISKVFNSAIGKWWVITHPNTENKDDNYLKVLSMMPLNAKQNSLITNYYATNERQMTSYS